MKKVLFVLAAMLPMVFTGCDKDEPDVISLKEVEKTLYFADEYQIEATSNAVITYTVENEYHAEVSETELVTAGFVGETNVILSNGEDTKEFKVIVKPESNLYPEPDIKFSYTKSSIIAKLGMPDYETETVIAYTDYSSSAPTLMFLFDDSNKLEGYSIMVKSAYTSLIADFLGERYLFVGEQDDTFVFINGLKPDTATMAIGLRLYNTSYWQVLYLPNTNSQSASLKSGKYFANTSAFDEIFKQLQ